MDRAVLQSQDPVSGTICHWPCEHHPARCDSFKAHWRQYCFVQPTGHDLALSWLFRPLEQRNMNFLTYLIPCYLHGARFIRMRAFVTDSGTWTTSWTLCRWGSRWRCAATERGRCSSRWTSSCLRWTPPSTPRTTTIATDDVVEQAAATTKASDFRSNTAFNTVVIVASRIPGMRKSIRGRPTFP